MAVYTYLGRLTNAQRLQFAASRNAQLSVQPVEPAYGPDGLVTTNKIPITVDESGAFSVRLEASGSLVGTSGAKPVRYQIVCDWQQDGENLWSVWGDFYALAGGGSVSDMRFGNFLGPGISYGFGPPEAHGVTTGAYIDISGANPVLYLPEGSRV